MTKRQLDSDSLGERAYQAIKQAFTRCELPPGEFVTEASDIAVVLFSSLRRVGIEDVAEQMLAWKKAMPERVHFDVPPLPEGEGGAPIDGDEEDDEAA